jgi:hypothetical protein
MFDYLVTAFWYVTGFVLFCAMIIGVGKIIDYVLNEIYDRDPW